MFEGYSKVSLVFNFYNHCVVKCQAINLFICYKFYTLTVWNHILFFKTDITSNVQINVLEFCDTWEWLKVCIYSVSIHLG